MKGGGSRRSTAEASPRTLALLLGATDREIGLIDRFAACFRDWRRQDLIEHEASTLVGQRVFGLAQGYGKSTLNRLELGRPEPTRRHKINHDGAMIERLLVDLFLEAHGAPPKQDHPRSRRRRPVARPSGRPHSRQGLAKKERDHKPEEDLEKHA